MPVPVPRDEVAGPASTALLWPNAQADLEGYGAHYVLFVSKSASHLDAFQVLTRMAAAVAQATNALGVYMGGAGMVVRRDLFVEMAQELELPVPLWIDFRCGGTEDGKTALFTVGLEQFEQMEIEIPASAKGCGDLRLWTMNLAGWLIETRPTIKPGETVGLTADERILVQHSRSMIDREDPVMSLTGI